VQSGGLLTALPQISEPGVVLVCDLGGGIRKGLQEERKRSVGKVALELVVYAAQPHKQGQLCISCGGGGLHLLLREPPPRCRGPFSVPQDA